MKQRRRVSIVRTWIFLGLVFGLHAIAVSDGSSAQTRTSPTTNVDIQEWDVPGGAGAFPHDPAVASDGSGWYTGYNVNVIGRVDPSGHIKEFQLPTPNSGPHGITADSQGNIWYTGNRVGLIGRLDPQSGKVIEYK